LTDWLIRIATRDDLEALVDFNCGIARETEDKELDRATVQKGVARGFEQGDDVVYYVASIADEAIGSLMLTREWSDWRDGWIIWIQSVYVVPHHRGRGVFRSLLSHVTSAVRQNPDVVGLRLYVEIDNNRAQSVYARTGFVDPGYRVLEKIF
jgi:GNAT superfamily N-acetyltransferase